MQLRILGFLVLLILSAINLGAQVSVAIENDAGDDIHQELATFVGRHLRALSDVQVSATKAPLKILLTGYRTVPATTASAPLADIGPEPPRYDVSGHVSTEWRNWQQLDLLRKSEAIKSGARLPSLYAVAYVVTYNCETVYTSLRLDVDLDRLSKQLVDDIDVGVFQTLRQH